MNYCLTYGTSETVHLASPSERGELLLGLRYFRNTKMGIAQASEGELLLGLRYFRNRAVVLGPLNQVLTNYR